MSALNLRPELPQEVIRRFQEGDRDAFSELLDRYETPFLNFAYRFLGDRIEAEDATQEALIEAYKSARRYRPTAKFSTWLFAILTHRCLNIRRQKRPKIKIEIKDLNIRDLKDNPISNYEDKELSIFINKAILELPENQRISILLSVYEEFSLAQTASLLKTSEGAVKQLLHRAKTTLEHKLKKFL